MKFSTTSPKPQRKLSNPYSRHDASHFFQNLYLFPIELQRFLKKALKKSTFAGKKSILSLINSKYFNINSKNPLNFQKNMQKVQLLTSLQEKQVEEIVKKDPAVMMNPINRVFLKGVHKKTQRRIHLKGEENKSEKQELYTNRIDVKEENLSFMQKYEENQEKHLLFDENQEKVESFSVKSEILIGLNFEYPEEFDLEKKNSNNSSEFNDFSTKDEAFFELENLDFSQNFNNYPLGKNYAMEGEFVGRIQKILGGKQVKDLTDMVFNGKNESLMQNLLEEGEKDVYL